MPNTNNEPLELVATECYELRDFEGMPVGVICKPKAYEVIEDTEQYKEGTRWQAFSLISSDAGWRDLPSREEAIAYIAECCI